MFLICCFTELSGIFYTIVQDGPPVAGEVSSGLGGGNSRLIPSNISL